MKIEISDEALSRIHREANDTKFSGFFTGFLEGIIASGGVEENELEPLVKMSILMLQKFGDEDANDLLEDFKADMLEFEQIEDIVEFRSDHLKSNCDKTAMNRFMGFCAGIACDDLITSKEAEGIVNFATANPSVNKDPISKTIIFCCGDAILDGVVDSIESAEICHAITRLVGDCYADTGVTSLGNIPVFEECELPELSEMFDKLVVLTGAFELSPRRLLEEALAEHGISSKTSTPCRKTDYVIVAGQASRDWKYTHKGTKIQRALELRQDFGKPLFISESTIMKMLRLAP